MAETTTRLNVKDISDIHAFDATGTPKTLPLILKDGVIKFTQCFPDWIETQDQNGAYLSGRDGATDKRSEITFDCDIFDGGGLTTEATIMDLITQEGYVGSTWASTTTTQSGERKKFGLSITFANRNSAGALKGCTLVWSIAAFVPPVNIEGARDGFTARGLTWRSTVQAPTRTRTT